MNRVLAATLAYNAALLASCVFVLRFGGRYERLTLILCIAAGVLTALLPMLRPWIGEAVSYAYLLVDVGLLVAFDAVMIRSTRYWPIWATGIQLAAVALGIAVAIDPETMRQYRLIQGKFAYLIFLSLILGSRPNGSKASSGAALTDSDPL